MNKLLQLFQSNSRKTKIAVMCALLTGFMTAMYVVRIFYTADYYYGSLLWNLFLAWLPFIFSWWAYKNYFKGGRKISILIPGFLWLIFFPNAPYIITDLVHLQDRHASYAPFDFAQGAEIRSLSEAETPEFPTGIPLWFDALLVFCFAFTGFVLGLSSLYMIHRVLHNAFSTWKSWLLIMLMIAMSGYGIYMGRILRWNSWDIFIHPLPLIHDVHDTILTPASLAMIVLFSVLMGITYPFLFYFVRSNNNK